MDEDIAIPLIIFASVLIFTWMMLNYRKWTYLQKQKGGQAGQENSMGLSELKDVLREAVAEAQEPLLERIETLEAEVRQAATPRLMPAQHDDRLGELKQSPVEQAEPAARRA